MKRLGHWPLVALIWLISLDRGVVTAQQPVVEPQAAPNQAVAQAQYAELQRLIAARDFPGALSLVDRLGAEGGLSADEQLEMRNIIGRARTDLILTYSREFRRALAEGNMQAYAFYGEQMQRLNRGEAPMPDLVEPAGGPPPGVGRDLTADKALRGAQSDKDIIKALRDGRLLEPPGQNALDLALEAIDRMGKDAQPLAERVVEAIEAAYQGRMWQGQIDSAENIFDSTLRRLIERSQGEQKASAAWASAQFDRLAEVQRKVIDDAEATWSAAADAAIQSLNLTVPSADGQSAVVYLGWMRDLLGADAEPVQATLSRILDAYQAVIEQALAEGEAGRADELMSRAEAIASEYHASLDRFTSQATAVQQATKAARERRLAYQEQVKVARERIQADRLVAPSADAALNWALRAEAIWPDAPDVRPLIKEIVDGFMVKIEALVQERRFGEALAWLDLLDTTLQTSVNDQQELLSALRARAEALKLARSTRDFDSSGPATQSARTEDRQPVP